MDILGVGLTNVHGLARMQRPSHQPAAIGPRRFDKESYVNDLRF
jgi:hypothetical protein